MTYDCNISYYICILHSYLLKNDDFSMLSPNTKTRPATAKSFQTTHSYIQFQNTKSRKISRGSGFKKKYFQEKN
jgi:hypothetical protein